MDDTEQFWNEPGPAYRSRSRGGAGGGPGSGGPGGPGHPGSGWPPAPGSGWPPAPGSGWPPAPGSGWPPAPGSGWPPAPGSGWPGHGSGELRQHYARDRSHALRWSAGIAVAVLLAAGGAIAGVSLAGRSSPAAPPAPAALSGSASPAAAGAAAPAGQAAVLNSALDSADSPAAPGYLDASGAVSSGPAVGGPAGRAAVARHVRRCVRARTAARLAGRPRLARVIRRACRHPALRRLALRGVHSEFTVRTRGGGFRTIAFERGTIESVSSGKDVVVRAPDGTIWTWNLVPATVVRANGHRASESALAVGDQVWAGGPVMQGARNARLIVVRPGTASSPG